MPTEIIKTISVTALCAATLRRRCWSPLQQLTRIKRSYRRCWSSLQQHREFKWRKLNFIFASIVLFSFVACKEENLASATWKWEDHRWIHGDKKSITMTAPDTTSVFQMDLKIDHSDKYAFNNLYVRTKTTYPSGKEVVSVTSLELVNPDGTWAGDYGENCCKLKLPLQRRFTFPEPGKYTWTIEPYMRIDTIAGIRKLTVTCSPVKE